MTDEREKTALANALLWLADAPLFIDRDQVARFHDAVVRPEYDFGPITLEQGRERGHKLGATAEGKAKVEPSTLLNWLSTVVPFVKAELEVRGEATGELERKSSTSHTVEVTRIKTPQRQLEQLVLHYLRHHPGRLAVPEPPWSEAWQQPEFALTVPRAVVLLDLPPGTKFIPTAAEFADGKVELLFERLTAADGKETPPYYPDPYPVTDAAKLRSDREAYWRWYDANFSASKAMRAVEEAAAGRGGIRWIDYRVPTTATGRTVHLHVAPAGEYPTGTFAYYLIKRGFKHGVRLVGTLRSEPDLNVLAVYEK